jgi:hypothetical protein
VQVGDKKRFPLDDGTDELHEITEIRFDDFGGKVVVWKRVAA